MKTISVFLALSLIISAASVSNAKKLSTLAEHPVHAGELPLNIIEALLVKRWDSNSPSYHQKHVEYAKAVTFALHKAPIPRNLLTMEKLSNLLYADNSEIFYNKNNFIRVQDYEKKKLSNVRGMLESLETMKLNKFALFKKLADAIRLDIVDHVKYPGIFALENIFSAHLPANDPKLSRIKKKLAKKFPDQAASDFISVGEKMIKLIHPEYKNFFAAEYIIDEIKLHPRSHHRLIKTVLSNSEYFQVAEYLDSALGNQDVREALKPALKKISQGSKLFPMRSNKVLERVLDNALSFGFDNIAAAVVEGAKKSKIKKYFVNKKETLPKIASTTEYQFGMLSTREGTGKFERSEMLFRKNMAKTIEKLIQIDSEPTFSDKVKKVFNKQQPKKLWLAEKWSNYLEESFLTQSKPNLKIYNIMKPHMGQEMPREKLNKLMYEAVRYGGLKNKPIIDDLLDRGASPTKVSVNGETLVHAALLRQDLDMLKYVVEKLHVPIMDGPGIKSILSTVLDTNPFPRYSPPQFWETLLYVIQNGKIDVPRPAPFDGLHQELFKPSIADTTSLTYSILMETDRQTVAELIFQLELSHGVENVSPGLKNYRKNFVLSTVLPDSPNPLTLTEIVLKYRGLGALTPYEQVSYESSIYSALHYDTNNKVLTTVQQERIIDAILENTGTEGDFKWAKRFANNPKLQGKFDIDRVSNLRSTLKNYETWKSGNKLTGTLKKQYPSSLKAAVSLTRADLPDPSHEDIVSLLTKPRYPTDLLVTSDSTLITVCDYIF